MDRNQKDQIHYFAIFSGMKNWYVMRMRASVYALELHLCFFFNFIDDQLIKWPSVSVSFEGPAAMENNIEILSKEAMWASFSFLIFLFTDPRLLGALKLLTFYPKCVCHTSLTESNEKWHKICSIQIEVKHPPSFIIKSLFFNFLLHFAPKTSKRTFKHSLGFSKTKLLLFWKYADALLIRVWCL